MNIQGWKQAGVRVALALVLPLAFAGAVQADEEDLEKKLVMDGIAAYEEGRYQDAADTLAKARALLPDHSPTALYLGLAYLKLDRRQDAIVAWQSYLKLEPSTEDEVDEDLQKQVGRYLTLLARAENEASAKAAIVREKRLGPGDPKTVAITYFRNLGSAKIAPLQKGLTALLIDDVSKAPGLEVVEREQLQALVSELALGGSGVVDAKNAPRVGRLLGAGKVSTGSFVDDAGRLQVDSVVADSGAGRVLGAQGATGDLEEFFEVEKTLALAILRDLGRTEKTLDKEGVLTDIQKPQTKSMPALLAFSEGLDAKDRADYDAARDHFEKALEEDDDFELARRQLLLLPLGAVAIGAMVVALEASAPSAATAAATTTSVAGASAGFGTTAVVVGAGAAVVGGAAVGVAAASDAFSSGGGGEGDGSSTPGSKNATCGNGVVEPGEACEPPFQQASACGPNQVCAGDCTRCVQATSCQFRCCPGRDDSCTSNSASCFCDQACRQFGDCCNDVGQACGF